MGGGNSAPAVRACTSASGEFDYQKYLYKDKGSYSVAVDGSEEKDCSPIYRHPDYVKGLETRGYPLDEGGFVDTVWAAWERGAKKFAKHDFLGWRPLKDDGKTYDDYTFITYEETHEVLTSWCKGLSALGVKKESNVGVFAQNRVEWTMANLSICGRGGRVVALYESLGEKAVEHILGQADIETLFTEASKLQLLDQLIKNVDGLKLKNVVVFANDTKYGRKSEVIQEDMVKAFAEKNINLISTTQMIEGGKDVTSAFDPPDADSLCNIMYTSGTTGLPKGVCLTHCGVLCNIGALSVIREALSPGDRHFSYLPLAHIFELAVQTACVCIGMNIAYFTGNMKRLLDDLNTASPHLFPGVPRVYSKFYSKFFAKVDGGSFIKKKLAYSGFSTSQTKIRTGERSGFYDKLLWSKVAGQMGFSRVKITATGAAPMPGYLMEFMKIVTNCPMIQGYGLTETAAGGTASGPKDNTVGHVGGPGSCTEIRLRAVAEMNYLPSDVTVVDGKEIPMPRGEVEIRGKSVFVGYFKNQKKTDEVLASDGWFSTGDIGRINPNGTLSIIDRKKNIFKLSQGEYIAVEKVESQYGKAASVGQIWVYGNSFKSFIVAIITPDVAWAQELLQSKGLWKEKDPANPAKLLTPEFAEVFAENMHEENKKVVREAIMEDLKANQGKLKGFEKIRGIWVEHRIDGLGQGFTVENNCLTPSFKLKRPQLINRYVKEIQGLYTAGGEAPKDGEKWTN